jgi:hypothetical protein
VLDRDKIVEKGSHHSLMSQGGYYAQLYNMFIGHQSPDYKPRRDLLVLGREMLCIDEIRQEPLLAKARSTANTGVRAPARVCLLEPI